MTASREAYSGPPLFAGACRAQRRVASATRNQMHMSMQYHLACCGPYVGAKVESLHCAIFRVNGRPYAYFTHVGPGFHLMPVRRFS